MGSLSNEPVKTLFDENVVPQAPEDPLFGLMAAYRKDTYEKKVDLGIGAYRDNNAKPWVLPVVKKVSCAKDGGALVFWCTDTVARLMRSCGVILTSIMNTCQLLVSPNSPLPHRNSSSVQRAPLSRKDEYAAIHPAGSLDPSCDY
jgi:hypothetical protein